MDNPMLNSILRWSISQTDTGSERDPNAPPMEMDPEKREFLERVMNQMVEDEGKSMKDLVEAIKGPEQSLEQASVKVDALEQAIDRCDKIDYAVGFHSFANGLFPTIELLETSEHGNVRATAAELIALVVKDNPPCQAWAFEGQALPRLLALHRGEVRDGGPVGETEKIRAVAALSALIQHTPEAQLAFLQAGGLDDLQRDLALDAPRRLRARTLFVTRSLVAESPEARRACLERAGLLTLLATNSVADDAECAEHATASLCALCEVPAGPKAGIAPLIAALPPDYLKLLRARMAKLEADPDAAEALAAACSLVEALTAA